MSEEVLIVSLLTVLGSIYVFYLKVKKEIINNEESKNKPISELNKSIIELNSTIRHMNEDSKTLKDRVDEHGKQIDGLNIKVGQLETKVDLYHKGA